MLPDPGIKHAVLRLRDMHSSSMVTVRGHGQGPKHMLATKLCYALGNVSSASSVTFLFVPQELDGGDLPARQSRSSLWRAAIQLEAALHWTLKCVGATVFLSLLTPESLLLVP